MRTLTALGLIAPLALLAISQPVAAQTRPSGPPAPLPASGGIAATADHESFTQQTQHEMQDWQHKLQELRESAKAKGQQVGSAAQHDLDKAWADTQVQAERVKAATIDNWENAKAGFQKASRDLADAWDRVRNGNK